MYMMVVCTPLENFERFVWIRTINVTDLSVLLIKLDEYVNYTISVQGYISVGMGPYSGPVTDCVVQ